MIYIIEFLLGEYILKRFFIWFCMYRRKLVDNIGDFKLSKIREEYLLEI